VTVPVPSRLYYPQPSLRKPLSGVRVSIGDTISLKGTHTTFSSRAWKSLYKDPSSATANYAQQLLNQGAIIVGKTKTAQFGTGAEWVDQQAPWSARGDGYHSTQGGSVGAASALVGYEWLDHSVGVDGKSWQGKTRFWSNNYRWPSSNGEGRLSIDSTSKLIRRSQDNLQVSLVSYQ
jgi:hypothetical protein